MRISKSTKTTVKASSASNNAPLTKAEVKKLWDTKALFIDFGDSDAMCQDNGYTLDQILKYMDQGYNVYIDEGTSGVKASNTSANDKALQHIKAAIDILGKSGDKSDVTRDSIANLGVVMFDLKGKK